MLNFWLNLNNNQQLVDTLMPPQVRPSLWLEDVCPTFFHFQGLWTCWRQCCCLSVLIPCHIWKCLSLLFRGQKTAQTFFDVASSHPLPDSHFLLPVCQTCSCTAPKATGLLSCLQMKITSFGMKPKWMHHLREVWLKISWRSPLSAEMNDASAWRIGMPVAQIVIHVRMTLPQR